MPDISLELRVIEFVTEQTVHLRAWRAYVIVEFATQQGPGAQFRCIVDPGAPFSVMPFSLWHDRGLQWARLGSRLTCVLEPSSSPLLWQGVACDMGEVFVDLLDASSGLQSGPHRVVAKFPHRPQIGPAENAAVLGMSFLADNDMRLVLDSTDGQMTGFLAVSDL